MRHFDFNAAVEKISLEFRVYAVRGRAARFAVRLGVRKFADRLKPELQTNEVPSASSAKSVVKFLN